MAVKTTLMKRSLISMMLDRLEIRRNYFLYMDFFDIHSCQHLS